jgi:hypothetical protein
MLSCHPCDFIPYTSSFHCRIPWRWNLLLKQNIESVNMLMDGLIGEYRNVGTWARDSWNISQCNQYKFEFSFVSWVRIQEIYIFELFFVKTNDLYIKFLLTVKFYLAHVILYHFIEEKLLIHLLHLQLISHTFVRHPISTFPICFYFAVSLGILVTSIHYVGFLFICIVPN